MTQLRSLIVIALLSFEVRSCISNPTEEDGGLSRYIIEGKVLPPEELESSNWQADINIHVNGGEYVAFVRHDGNFVIHNVTSGSYLIEFQHPDYMYEPVRVEINSKGKYRARKVNYIQPSQVIQLPYPIRIKPLGKFRYFQVREQWQLTDFIFNPAFLMLVLPLLLIMILPKMMNDPETKEEMKQIGNLTKMSELPEMSEMFTSLFSGSTTKPNTKAKQIKKKQ